MNNIEFIASILVLIVVIVCCLAIVMRINKSSESVPHGTNSEVYFYDAELATSHSPITKVFNSDEIELASLKHGALPVTKKIIDIEIISRCNSESIAQIIADKFKIPLEHSSVDPSVPRCLSRLHKWIISRSGHDDFYIVSMFPFANYKSYDDYYRWVS